MSDTEDTNPAEADAPDEAVEQPGADDTPAQAAPAEESPGEAEATGQADDAGEAAAPTPVVAEEDDGTRAVRKLREGRVVSNGMNKTAVVLVTDRVRHPRYNKTVQRSKKLHVHDETDTLKLGDIVRVMETRPLSKTKRWRLVEVIERAR